MIGSKMNKRPLSVAIIGWLYIAVGAITFAYEFRSGHPFQYDMVWAELVRLIAIVSGVYLLRGRNWARWLALAWIAFHVVLSAFHSLSQVAIHGMFCAAIAYFLFRPQTTLYFGAVRTQST